MEGIVILNLSVDEEDRPYGNSRNNDEKDSSQGMGWPGQKAERGSSVAHMGDIKEVLYDLDGLKFGEGSGHISLGDLIEEKDHAKNHD